MSVLSRIQSIQTELSSAEKKIFDFIKENPEQIATMTAEQIANASSVSAPTVVRFAKKIGFNSLTEFKIRLSTDLQQNFNPDSYADVALNESIASLKNKLSQNAQLTIHETAKLLDERLLLKAAEHLESASRIIVAGSGASHLVAEDISQKWGRIGTNITVENDYNSLVPQLTNASKKTVLWLVSNSGTTPEIIGYAKTAKQLGIPLITLTRFGPNPLSKLATVPLQVSNPKESSNRSAATDSIIAQFLAVDILFYLFISRNPSNADHIRRSSEAIDLFRKDYL